MYVTFFPTLLTKFGPHMITWLPHEYSDSECISRTLYLYLKIFKTILMGLWTNTCDVTNPSSLNYSRSLVKGDFPFIPQKVKTPKSTLTKWLDFCCCCFLLHWWVSQLKQYSLERLEKFKYLTNYLKLDSSNTFRMEQWRLT